MLSREGARLQVFLELRRLYGLRRGLNDLLILDEQVIELPGGWVFPWTTRGFCDGDMRYAAGGNTPIYIERESGHMRPWEG